MSLEREKTEIPCPGGGRPIKTTYGDLARKSSLKSSKGHEYKFKSSNQSKLKQSMNKIEKLKKDYERNMERTQKDFSRALNDVIGNADILLKR
tara:strand:- start:228 stop:506 length:279 start_codon:yes stop_codon:yes gene_type:complete